MGLCTAAMANPASPVLPALLAPPPSGPPLGVATVGTFAFPPSPPTLPASWRIVKIEGGPAAMAAAMGAADGDAAAAARAPAPPGPPPPPPAMKVSLYPPTTTVSAAAAAGGDAPPAGGGGGGGGGGRDDDDAFAVGVAEVDVGGLPSWLVQPGCTRLMGHYLYNKEADWLVVAPAPADRVLFIRRWKLADTAPAGAAPDTTANANATANATATADATANATVNATANTNATPIATANANATTGSHTASGAGRPAVSSGQEVVVSSFVAPQPGTLPTTAMLRACLLLRIGNGVAGSGGRVGTASANTPPGPPALSDVSVDASSVGAAGGPAGRSAGSSAAGNGGRRAGGAGARKRHRGATDGGAPATVTTDCTRAAKADKVAGVAIRVDGVTCPLADGGGAFRSIPPTSGDADTTSACSSSAGATVLRSLATSQDPAMQGRSGRRCRRRAEV